MHMLMLLLPYLHVFSILHVLCTIYNTFHSWFRTHPCYWHTMRMTENSFRYFIILFYFRFYLIYPLYVPYFCDIPRVELGNVMGIPMTGKSFQYFIGLQVSNHYDNATGRCVIEIQIGLSVCAFLLLLVAKED